MNDTVHRGILLHYILNHPVLGFLCTVKYLEISDLWVQRVKNHFLYWMNQPFSHMTHQVIGGEGLMRYLEGTRLHQVMGGEGLMRYLEGTRLHQVIGGEGLMRYLEGTRLHQVIGGEGLMRYREGSCSHQVIGGEGLMRYREGSRSHQSSCAKGTRF